MGPVGPNAHQYNVKRTPEEEREANIGALIMTMPFVVFGIILGLIVQFT